MPRVIDHLVLPVTDIDVARSRYEALGFTVAPTGQHPFGTENCCIFFSDNTFLEPLAVAHRETCEKHARRGNSFVRNDQDYRFRCGDEGLSHMVIKSSDAKSDNSMYRREGIGGGNMVKFSRAFKTPSGDSGRVSFHLAFAQDSRSPDAGFFSCEVINPPVVDRSALKRHDNAVVGIKEIILSEQNPTDFQYFFQSYLDQRLMDADSFGMSFETETGLIRVLTPVGMKALYNVETERTDRGMRYELFVLASSDLDETRNHLTKAGISFSDQNGQLAIAPAPGQGVPILIEESNS